MTENQLNHRHLTEFKDIHRIDRKSLIQLIKRKIKIYECAIDRDCRVTILSIYNGDPYDAYFPHLKILKYFDDKRLNIDFVNKHNRLKELILGRNLQEFPKLNLRNLRKLDLSNNNISEINSLISLPRLRKLILSKNKFTSLTELKAFKNCNCLEYIDLRNNIISNLNEFKPLSYLKKCKSIDLSHNKIFNLNIKYNVPKLIKLNLSNNDIHKIIHIKNLLKLRELDLSHNKISILENIRTVPVIELITVDFNPINFFRGIENINNSCVIERIPLTNFTYEQRNLYRSYFDSIGVEYIDHDEFGLENIIYLTLFISKCYNINKYLSVSFNEQNNEIYVRVNNKRFVQCFYLLLNINNKKDHKNISQISSIDEASERLSNTDNYKIPIKEIFWGHCSNLQTWAEHNYDTTLLHRNLAFPLLKELVKVGDSKAKKVFKEEIATRLKSGYPSVVTYLKKEGYLKYLTTDELSSLEIP